jgi:diguanylate cyclase (GGDEF)-like protein
MTGTMVSDVSKRARRDTLTGLENRAAWAEDAHQAAEPLVVAMIDLDGLKAVNDGQGHDAGDKYLQKFASDLAGAMPSGATPYRFGGDEYAVRVLGGSVEGLRSTLAELQERSGVAPFSFGIARAFEDGNDPDRVLEVADARMYEMKGDRKTEEGSSGDLQPEQQG